MQEYFCKKMKAKPIASFSGLFIPRVTDQKPEWSYICIYETEQGKITVHSDCPISGNYNTFEDFMDDLCLRFPWWIGCHTIKADVKFKKKIEGYLTRMIVDRDECTIWAYRYAFTNWRFEQKDGKGILTNIEFLKHDFVLRAILNSNRKNSLYDAMFKVKETERPYAPPASKVLDLLWDGYCPESRLKGKRVRMRMVGLYYESIETGLRIVCSPDGMAIIMKVRGDNSGLK